MPGLCPEYFHAMRAEASLKMRAISGGEILRQFLAIMSLPSP
jgi:hypothetical protein